MHELLAQEPWCFHPADVAGLTDWQIENLYARPAAGRIRRLEAPPAETQPTPGPPATDLPSPGAPEFREWVISQFVLMGMTRADAVAQYEDQARQG
jgi:hypothetical protein